MKKKLACAGVLILVLLKAASWWFDIPLIADPFPEEIAKTLEGTNARCYVYHVAGGFLELNRTDLWRIDGDAGEIAAVVKALHVEEVPTAPAPFWKMQPYYWPRSLQPGMKCYRSNGFNDDGTANGRPYQSCIVTDIPNHRAYVWHVEVF